MIANLQKSATTMRGSHPGRALHAFVSLLFAVLVVWWPSQAQAQAGPDFTATPTLVSGTNLRQGAVYRFPNVLPGIDALVTLAQFSNVIQLDALDTPAPFPNRFQPVIECNQLVAGVVTEITSNVTCWVRFDFQFVQTGTNTPAPVPRIAASAQDVDGGNGTGTAGTREFAEFIGAAAVTVAAPTFMTAAPALGGGTRFIQSSAANAQAGIGTDNRYEIYADYQSNLTGFSIIGGNTIGASPCNPATANSCNRLNSYTFQPLDSIGLSSIRVLKTSNGGVGTFSYSGTNGFISDTITTTAAGTATSAEPQPVTSGVSTTITEAPPTGFRLTAITCTGLGTGGTATPTINGVSGGNVLLNAAAMTASNVVCTFTNEKLAANLALTKTNTPGVNGNVDQPADTVTAGVTTTYTIVVNNAGPDAANNTVITDPAPTGLTCTTATCAAAGGAACPAQTGAALVTALQGAGATVPTLPNGGTVTITMTCTVN